MLTREDRETILEVTAADPAYMLDLLETTMYASDVDTTAVQEARIIIAELARLCATTMDPGTRARVAGFLEETDPNYHKVDR